MKKKSLLTRTSKEEKELMKLVNQKRLLKGKIPVSSRRLSLARARQYRRYPKLIDELVEEI